MNRIRTGLTFAVLLGLAPGAAAQQAPFAAARVADYLPTPGIARNFVSELLAQGDTLWVGPRLNMTPDGGVSWFQADLDSLTDGRSSLYALDVEGATVWVALGARYQQDVNGDGTEDDIFENTGYAVSEDGGRTWTYRLPPLDQPEDTVEVYGVSRLEAQPLIVPQLATSFDLDYDPRTGLLWTANWYGGLRRSADGGRTWDRVVLPPDTLFALRPDVPYDFVVAPPPPSPSARYNNFFAFSVHVDAEGTVWAGTAAGINRSQDGGTSWDRFTYDGTPEAPVGDWVIAIREQELAGRNALWFASRPATQVGENYGVTVTRDGGAHFEQVLIGEPINDLAFQGETVYAAGENGLFVSDDGGRSWYTIRSFTDVLQPDRLIRPDVDVLSVATTDEALWVGTEDGLLKSRDGGRTWRVYRAEVPVNPEVPSEAVPRVETYAYPNPFSMPIDRFVRIRYDLPERQSVQVRIFDFGMNLVRRLADEGQEPGAREVVWDGTDDNGLRVANGTYFYAVETEGETYWGKILVLE